MRYFISTVLIFLSVVACREQPKQTTMDEIQLTSGSYGHTLNPTQVFSGDGKWVVYDTRNQDGHISRTGGIEKVNVETSEVIRLYTAMNQTLDGPGVGAASWNPATMKIIFIHGLMDCNAEKPYGFTRRFGAIIDGDGPGGFRHAEARTIRAPFVAGALRGGTHAYTWSGDGLWISYTYNDAIVEALEKSGSTARDLRTIGVMSPVRPVDVVNQDADNFSGSYFAVVAASVTESPQPGSDEIDRAFDECWIGANGYLHASGERQIRAIAFQGNVRTKGGEMITEVFVSDMPEEITRSTSVAPLEGTEHTRPNVPLGQVQRRLTFTQDRKYPGLQGPRVRLRTSPDGSIIYFHMKDDAGIVQIFTIPTVGGEIRQLTHLVSSIQAQYNLSPDGQKLAVIAGNRILLVDSNDGSATALTEPRENSDAPLTAVLWNPEGTALVYNRYVPSDDQRFLQIFRVNLSR